MPDVVKSGRASMNNMEIRFWLNSAVNEQPSTKNGVRIYIDQIACMEYATVCCTIMLSMKV